MRSPSQVLVLIRKLHGTVTGGACPQDHVVEIRVAKMVKR